MLVYVDALNDIAEFLTSHRARLAPEQAGLRLGPARPRRVKGLRCEEVASLAGVSVEYYKRLERGSASGVSDGVLEALARAKDLVARSGSVIRSSESSSSITRSWRSRPTTDLRSAAIAPNLTAVRRRRFDLLASWAATPEPSPTTTPGSP
jgi:transcriptional regulator with XRE-family HTH domain